MKKSTLIKCTAGNAWWVVALIIYATNLGNACTDEGEPENEDPNPCVRGEVGYVYHEECPTGGTELDCVDLCCREEVSQLLEHISQWKPACGGDNESVSEQPWLYQECLLQFCDRWLVGVP